MHSIRKTSLASLFISHRFTETETENHVPFFIIVKIVLRGVYVCVGRMCASASMYTVNHFLILFLNNLGIYQCLF